MALCPEYPVSPVGFLVVLSGAAIPLRRISGAKVHNRLKYYAAKTYSFADNSPFIIRGTQWYHCPFATLQWRHMFKSLQEDANDLTFAEQLPKCH